MMATFTICFLLACAVHLFLPVKTGAVLIIKSLRILALIVPGFVLAAWLPGPGAISVILFLSPFMFIIMHNFLHREFPVASLVAIKGNYQHPLTGLPIYAFKQIDTAYKEIENNITLPVPLQKSQEEQLEGLLEAVILAQMLFLRHRYTIGMLSQVTGVQIHHLSAFINKKYGMNFNDFINEYRIRYCIGKFQNQEWRNKTLEALAEESGFNNRNSFTNAFKKFVGTTPSSYLKQFKCEIAA